MDYRKYVWGYEWFASPDSLTEFINKKELNTDEFKIITRPRHPDDFRGGGDYILFYLKNK